MFFKKPVVDLNTTQIYTLDINKKKHCIEVKIVFSIDKRDEYYRVFVKDTLNYTTPDHMLFKLEDYTQYLSDNAEYDLIDPQNTMLFTKIEGSSRLYMTPSPHSNLLQQRVQRLIQYNYPKLELGSDGLFTYYEYVDNSNSAKGILKDLKRMKAGKKINTNTTDECWLFNAIKSLDLHWN